MPMTDHLNPTTLRALAKRVEAGEYGWPINAEVLVALGEYRWDNAADKHSYGEKFLIHVEDGSYILHHTAPPLTTSLDAVEALRVRLLPDYTVDIHSGDARDSEGRWYECIMECWSGKDRDEDASTTRSFGFVPEVSVRLAALLFALAAKVEGETADA